jgi:ADP-ribose pyrophosphatase YjhB (NUDIX family)
MATFLETLTLPRFCHQCGGPLRQRLVDGEDRPRLVCDQCGFIHYVNPKIVVGAIPERAGRVLLMRRGIEPRYGAWTFPGGFMEIDETAEEAALREAQEEVGLSLKLGRLLGVYSRPGARRESARTGGRLAASGGRSSPTHPRRAPEAGTATGEGPGILAVVFRAGAGRTPPRVGDECLEIAWFRPEDIPWDELAFDTTHWALRDWVALKDRRRRSPG